MIYTRIQGFHYVRVGTIIRNHVSFCVTLTSFVRETVMFCSDIDYADIEAVREQYPSAAEIVECDGGWQVFETFTDAEFWYNQL